MIFEPFPDFLPSEYRVKFATEAWERREAAALRRTGVLRRAKNFRRRRSRRHRRRRDPDRCVVVVRRGLAGSRRHGAHPPGRAGHLVGLAACGRPRLPAAFRRSASSLIRLAVCSAHARGCRRFLAHVQAQNAPMFQRLHWRHDRGDGAARASASLHARRPHPLSADRGRRDRISVAAKKAA